MTQYAPLSAPKLKGLTSAEARKKLLEYGPNMLREEKENSLLLFLQKFWAPVPWMLEIIILLELILGKYVEAWIIAALILFNAALSFFQESKAKNALRLLRKKLDVQVRALRDGQWALVSATEIVPEDLVCLHRGDIVPADAKILEGHISLDQSALTGESLPVEPGEGEVAYAGSIVKQGEVYARVTATGKDTFYGKTAEILRTTKTPSHLETTIFSIVKSLVLFDAMLVVGVFSYSFSQGLLLSNLIPFSLLLLVASVPVALPATYALATALGAIELSKLGVFITRLSAIEEAAAMNILCVDKTGTITENTLVVSNLHLFGTFTGDDLLKLAVITCHEATQDPLDLAILAAANERKSGYDALKKEKFIPFDPERKCAEAIVRQEGREWHVLKGEPNALLKMVGRSGEASEIAHKLSADGSRLLAVIFGEENKLELVGFIALHDKPRATSKKALEEIKNLGVKVMMMTGDELATAKSIAQQVGLESNAISLEEVSKLSDEELEKIDVISGVFPEDKFHIIQRLQKRGHICGMTGDGVNDAPALKKAEVGIAVSSATDVAKSAASLVLASPGLVDIVEAIKTSRRIYQRMLTYILNKIIKTFQISLLLGVGLVVTNQFIISQLLIVLLLFANDFVTMSISTDTVSYSQKPDKWDIRRLVIVGAIFATFILALSFFMHFVGLRYLHLPINELRTWIFLLLVFSGQSTIYLVRERKYFWGSMPSRWMIISSLSTIAIVTALATKGILMTPIPIWLVLGLLAAVVIYFSLLDLLKVRVVRFFRL